MSRRAIWSFCTRSVVLANNTRQPFQSERSRTPPPDAIFRRQSAGRAASRNRRRSCGCSRRTRSDSRGMSRSQKDKCRTPHRSLRSRRRRHSEARRRSPAVCRRGRRCHCGRRRRHRQRRRQPWCTLRPAARRGARRGRARKPRVDHTTSLRGTALVWIRYGADRQTIGVRRRSGAPGHRRVVSARDSSSAAAHADRLLRPRHQRHPRLRDLPLAGGDETMVIQPTAKPTSGPNASTA